MTLAPTASAVLKPDLKSKLSIAYCLTAGIFSLPWASTHSCEGDRQCEGGEAVVKNLKKGKKC